MKVVRRIGFGFMVAALGAGILLACGDDDAVILSVEDSGSDGSSDGRANGDATPPKNDVDAPVVDSGNDSTSPIVDAGADVDADEPVDAQADVVLPPVDSGAPDADAGDLAREFPARLAAAACATAARCCFGNPDLAAGATVDGGTYQQQKCLNNYLPNGISLSNPGLTADFSKLSYNPTKATECLGRMQALTCNSNAAEYRALVDACYDVLQGTVPTGSPCALTTECAPGNFCNSSVNGGTCEAIRNTGATCGDWTTNAGFAQFSCSNRFSGEPPRHCVSRTDAGSLPQAQWVCGDARPNGEYCANDSWCSTGVCPTNKLCSGFIEVYTPGFCGALATP